MSLEVIFLMMRTQFIMLNLLCIPDLICYNYTYHYCLCLKAQNFNIIPLVIGCVCLDPDAVNTF